ncbi:FecR domain-containing protein [Sphingomonas sp. BT-65]|uniref:FecR family protein n=1 Tax=Sphingomonas sp. BT-65 TaxID=2989821 RepID=UPI002235843A|nr:FecR domain-containing protein [Sphingomonas sp. BT-65]MCW4460808.1 FecR domain-containing protein [Sphingomonas sp. BT-65]
MSRVDPQDMPEGRDEEAAIWCMRLAEDRLSPHEQREFDAWLAVPGNAEAFDDAVLVWQTAEAAAHRPEVIHARTEALDAFRDGNSRRWVRRASRRWYWPVGTVAAILLVALTSLMLLHDPVQVFETGIGERRIAMLQDGSRLSLDAATKVDVHLASNRRELTLLSGRAKFDVARDPLRPFSVLAGDKLIVATGTSFSVEILRGQVRVLLYEGHVDVLDQPSGGAAPRQLELKRAGGAPPLPAAQALTPGRELVTPISAGTATIALADLPRSLSWEGGQLSFDGEALPAAVERMNRYAAKKLVVGDSYVASLKVDGVYTAGDTDAFVEGMSALYGVKAVPGADSVTLKRD